MPDVHERLTTALAERYTIERELGRGGMATVYLARDLKRGVTGIGREGRRRFGERSRSSRTIRIHVRITRTS
jgi:serine/threonine protein kinase